MSSQINARVKELLRQDLKLGADARIDDDMPLIGGEFELDSLDVVLLIGSIEKHFGVKLPPDVDAQAVFGSVGSVVAFIESQLAAGGGGAAQGGPTPEPDLQALLGHLPHAAPFRFVSRLLHVTPGASAEGVWTISGEEDFLKGHFPGRPIVPGVLLAEALAQVSGIITAAPNASRHAGEKPGTIAALAQFDIRFRKMVEPPAEIQLSSRLMHVVDALEQFEVRARIGDGVVAEGSLTLALPGRMG